MCAIDARISILIVTHERAYIRASSHGMINIVSLVYKVNNVFDAIGIFQPFIKLYVVCGATVEA